MSEHDGSGNGRQVDRRRISRLVRDAALGAYGVASVGGHGLLGRLVDRLRRGVAGVEVELSRGLSVEVHLALVEGVPARAVAANVEESVRYLVQRETGMAIDELTIVVDGQLVDPAHRASDHG